MKTNNLSRITVIGGKWRGRWIQFPDIEGIRPTPNRVRETIFNWLMMCMPEAHCLDAFAGSGALSFEALSRGAASVYVIEKNRLLFTALKENAARFGGQKMHMQLGDFFACAPGDQQFNLIFLDPPFHQGFILPALQKLIDQNSLATEHRIYIEVEKAFDFSCLPKGFEVLKNKVAGQVRYGLLHFVAPGTDRL